MRTKLVGALGVLAILLMAAPGLGDDVEWEGVNSEATSSWSDTDVDDENLWWCEDDTEYRDPTGSDRAYFNFDRDDWTYMDRVDIKPGSSFAPGDLYLGGIAWCQPGQPLWLLKNMSVGTLKINAGGNTSNYGTQALRIGSTSGKAELSISSGWGDDVILKGNDGQYEFDFDGLSAAQVVSAINAQSGSTGVEATGESPILVRSVDAGADQFVEVVSGTFPTKCTFGFYYNTTLYKTYGYDDVDATLTLTGSAPLDMTVGASSLGRVFRLYGSSALVFSGSNITLSTPAQSYNKSTVSSGNTIGDHMYGSGSVEFTNSGGTITLSDPGKNEFGCLTIGQNTLKVRHDQTWNNCQDGTGFIRMRARTGSLVDSIVAEQRLDNLDEVAFYIENRWYQSASPMTIPGGTYQGITLYGGDQTTTSGGAYDTYDLTGDVELAGARVVPGDGSSTDATLDADYSLYLSTTTRWQIAVDLDGYSLTTEKGIRLRNATYSESAVRDVVIDARKDGGNPGTTYLNIGGKLELSSAYRYAGSTYETRKLGILGDDDLEINLAGDFTSNVRSLSSNGLHDSVMNCIGGSAQSFNTYEVGANIGDDFVAGTTCIEEWNVGDGATAGFVQLVDANRNDHGSGWSSGDEALLVEGLNIKAGSTLDANAMNVKIGTGSLTIAATGTLDLNTGVVLEDEDKVMTFFGMGDQTAAWASYEDYVTDSDNPDMSFVAVTTTKDLGAGAVTVTVWEAEEDTPPANYKYAAPSSTGSGDGSSPSNRCTLAYARDNFADGTIVWLADGTYTGVYSEYDGDAVEREDWYTLKAENPGDAIVEGVKVGTTGDKYDAYLRLEGLVLQPTSGLPDCIEAHKVRYIHAKDCDLIGHGWGPGYGASTYVLPENQWASWGVKLNDTPEYITLEDCWFGPPETGPVSDPDIMHTGFSRAIQGYGHNITITGCEIVNCEMFMCGAGNDWVIENTYAHDCYSDFIVVHSGDDWIIRDCVFDTVYGDKCWWYDVTYMGYYNATTDILTKTSGDDFLLLLKNSDGYIKTSWNSGANYTTIQTSKLNDNTVSALDYSKPGYPLYGSDIGSSQSPVEFHTQIVHGYHEDLIQWYACSGSPDWDNALIERCIFTGSGGQGIFTNKDTSYDGRVTNLTMRNCFVADTDAVTTWFKYADNTTLEHCTFYNHRNGEDTCALHFSTGVTNPAVTYCLVCYPMAECTYYNTTYSVGYGHLNWGFPGETNEDLGLGATGLNKFKDCLVDYDNFGYELDSSNEAIDFCTTSSQTKDIDNDDRDDDPDAGCHEYAAP